MPVVVAEDRLTGDLIMQPKHDGKIIRLLSIEPQCDQETANAESSREKPNETAE
jgi:hypothetical protein